MLDSAVRSVAVIGGGIVGWSAAAALKRRLPALAVTIVPVEPPADAFADRIRSTLPSVIGFNDDLGLHEADAVLRTGAGLRLGTRFERWVDDAPDYVHAYGEHGQPFGTASFHHHWVRAHHAGGAAPFDDHAPAAQLARAGRFAPPGSDPASPFSRLEHGLTLDLPAYRAMLAAFARHVGVSVRDGTPGDVRIGADGTVDAVALENGEVTADLFVDATGPAALLRGRLDDEWEDWSHWLPCDRLIEAEAPPTADPSPLDRCVAMAAGWRWVVQSAGATSHGLVYSGAHLTDEAAIRALRGVAGVRTAVPIAFRQGTRPEPWRRNCVAVGDAATVLEPLEWTNLHLALSAIDRIVAMMPGRTFAPVEIADFNRQVAAETARVRDFVVLHYAASRRPEPFWRAVAAVEPPASLAYTMRLFAERGRLPFFEEETFAKDSWLAVLIGQGVIPRRADPLIEATPTFVSDQAMAGFRDAISAALPSFPTPSAYLAAQKRQLPR